MDAQTDNITQENLNTITNEPESILNTDGRYADFEQAEGFLTYDNVIKSVRDISNLTLEKDDPILMLVPILNAFLNEQKKNNTIYCSSIKSAITESTKKYVQQVYETTSSLGDLLKNASISEIRIIFEKYNASLRRHEIHMKYCTLIICLSSIINVIVFIIMSLNK